MTTSKQILKKIGCDKLNLYHDKDYWYFVYDDPENNVFEHRPVYVPRLNQLPLNSWVQEGFYFVQKVLRMIEERRVDAEEAQEEANQITKKEINNGKE